MQTIYTYDASGIYSGEYTITDIYAPVPSGLDTPPPSLTGTQVAQRVGDSWIILDSYPIVPLFNQIPQVVTMRQARLALLGADLLPAVTGAINSLPSPQKEAASIEWEYSQTVERNRGFVLTLGAALGLTETQLDDLFILANAL